MVRWGKAEEFARQTLSSQRVSRGYWFAPLPADPSHGTGCRRIRENPKRSLC